jgi:hypothetical protein
MANRWATVTLIESSGRRRSVDLVASSVFDAAHLFVAHAKENPRNGLPRPTTESVFEVSIGGKVHRVTGKALQRWILREGQEHRGSSGYMVGKRPALDENRRDLVPLQKRDIEVNFCRFLFAQPSVQVE